MGLTSEIEHQDKSLDNEEVSADNASFYNRTIRKSNNSETKIVEDNQKIVQNALGRALPFIRSKGFKKNDLGSERSFKLS
jgi:hypothetical protein